MTYRCGKLPDVGDKGQRYEVTFLDPGGKRVVFGWSETSEGADIFVDSINKHPVLEAPEIRDRRPEA